MGRPKRADEAGGIYHALNRGNSRAAIFDMPDDFDDEGNLASETTLDGTTTYAYDHLGRMLTVTSPYKAGSSTYIARRQTYVYDAVGNVVAEYDGDYAPWRNENRYDVDDDGDVDTDDSDAIVAYLNTNGASYLPLPTSGNEPPPYVDANGDGLVSPLDVSIVLGYLNGQQNGNPPYQVTPNGTVVQYAYDDLDRLIGVTDENGDVTSYTYDANGNRLTLTDPEENTTTWTYDFLDRMTSDTNELNDARYYEYDAAGNLTEYTDRNGRVTQYAYDNLQRRTTETWLDGVTTVNTISYGYDAASQLVSVTDASAAYDFTYDRLGRITSTEYDLAALGYDVVLDQAYDALNRRIRLAAEIDGTDDLRNEYAYDFLNRMTQVTQAGQVGGNTVAEKRVDFTYDADDKHLLTSAARYADLAGTELVVTGLYTYNNFDKLSILKYQDATSTDIAEYQWGYDTQGRVSGVYIIGHGSENYRYDGTDQITRTTDNSTYTTTNFTYDDNGNRIDGSRTIGDNNQILSDGTYNYAYDDEGNITLRTNIADGSYTVYEWDHRNRLGSVTDYDVSDVKQQQVVYGYDAYNNLISRDLDSNGDGTFDESGYFIYDNGQIVLQLDSTGDVDHRMLWGAAVDQILADENDAGDVHWMLTDNQNTVRDIAEYDDATDTTSIVNHIAYSVFGEVTSQTNSSLDALPFYYTARYFDEATGLQYNTNRWYNPELGRWMSQDPIGFEAGDENLYRYVGNGHLNAVDPSGLREGHHWVPKSVFNAMKGLLDKKALKYFEQFTEIPEGYIHRFDSWVADGFKVSHDSYNKSVQLMMDEYVALNKIGRAKRMTELQAREFASFVRGFDTPPPELLNKKGFSEALKNVSTWREGFLKANSLAEALSKYTDDCGKKLSEKEVKNIIRNLVNGESRELSESATQVMKKFTRSTSGKSLLKLATTEVVGNALGKLFILEAARKGYNGEGLHKEGGVVGAAVQVLGERIYLDVVDDLARAYGPSIIEGISELLGLRNLGCESRHRRAARASAGLNPYGQPLD
ncbi:RHS repeat-associated core domain-containing protein [Blastopirellula retiformator]|uniref:Putative deoxyribonuclease RhsC n=1 Tax=Blastopirellula retiformator TaxID=2527970 RepID=A0A5C5UVJ3_9BACT|nr:RHS repeat-associated core domain-containing protein [Blastopirellula retiformator]TWT29623.1 putative deoxyribonuclease RhsC [Blastopirellula retiformator]